LRLPAPRIDDQLVRWQTSRWIVADKGSVAFALKRAALTKEAEELTTLRL
jgi:hypothetical protein